MNKLAGRSFDTKIAFLVGMLHYPINRWRYKYFGKNSVIHKPMRVTGKNCIAIGENVFFRENLRMEAITLKEKSKPQIIINNNTTAEQRCQIFCTKSLYIGKNVTISSDVFITDVVHEYKNIRKGIHQQKLISGKTYIGDMTFIGTGVKIIKPVKIGKHVIIGANSVVTHNIPSYCVAAGAPARIIKKYDFNTNEWINVDEG